MGAAHYNQCIVEPEQLGTVFRHDAEKMLIKLNNSRIYSARTAIPAYVTLGQAPKTLHTTRHQDEACHHFFSILSASMQEVSSTIFFQKSHSVSAKVEVTDGDDISRGNAEAIFASQNPTSHGVRGGGQAGRSMAGMACCANRALVKLRPIIKNVYVRLI